MSIMVKIQSELHAPKGQKNTFGNYRYRSCEDIIEAVKPILKDNECWLNITDEMVMLGDRFYVRATASIIEGGKTIGTACGYARESLVKKGMDDSQITGTASSYARKYALNGLLAIDDTKDADSQDNSDYQPTKVVEMITPDQATEISDLLTQSGANTKKFFEHYKCVDLDNMPKSIYHRVKGDLEKKIDDNSKGEKK